MTDADTEFAAQTHLRCLPHGFFPRLGEAFLGSYYRSFAAGPHAAALVAWSDGQRLGMLVGTVHNHAHYGWVLRTLGWRLGLAGARGLARHPGTAILFLRTRVGRYLRGIVRHVRPARPGRQARERSQTGPADEGLDVAVLTHVAVLPESGGRRVGEHLVRAFESAVADRGLRRIVLVTEPGRHGAGGFYERLGWRAEGERLAADGRTVATYSRSLDPAC